MITFRDESKIVKVKVLNKFMIYKDLFCRTRWFRLFKAVLLSWSLGKFSNLKNKILNDNMYGET